jgi:hypothetical protein
VADSRGGETAAFLRAALCLVLALVMVGHAAGCDSSVRRTSRAAAPARFAETARTSAPAQHAAVSDAGLGVLGHEHECDGAAVVIARTVAFAPHGGVFHTASLQRAAREADVPVPPKPGASSITRRAAAPDLHVLMVSRR